MKILLIHQYFLEDDDPGGSRWNEMLKFWADDGNKVTVLAGMIHANGHSKRDEYKKLFFKKKFQGKIEVIRCHVSAGYNKNFSGRLSGYFSFMLSCLWAGLFKATDSYDVVIVTSPPLFIGISGYIISRIKKIPMIFEVRDLWPESAIDTGVLKSSFLIKVSYWVENFIYRKSNLINVLTPAFYAILRDKKQIDSKKLIMIPNAADFNLSDHLLDTFDAEEFRRKMNLEGKFIITYIGAHGIANYLDQILDAAKLLEDTNVSFLLIGQGMDKKRLQEKSEFMKSKNVIFLDPVPKVEVFKYIIASDMGISVLKKVDTFKTIYSNKTFDYMSCKKPILMAIDGVSRELIEESMAGTYVEPENIKAFNKIIRNYIENPQRLKIEGNNGYCFAKENFDRIKLARKYLDNIKMILKN